MKENINLVRILIVLSALLQLSTLHLTSPLSTPGTLRVMEINNLYIKEILRLT